MTPSKGKHGAYVHKIEVAGPSRPVRTEGSEADQPSSDQPITTSYRMMRPVSDSELASNAKGSIAPANPKANYG